MTKQQLIQLITSRKRTVVVLLALATVNIILAVFKGVYQEPRIAELRDEWTSKRSLNTGARRDVSSIYRQGTEDLKVYRERLTPKRGFTALMMEVFETAADNGLTVKGVTYKPKQVPDQKLVVYDVVLSLGGTYAGIKSFLSDLQCHRSMLVVESLSLNSGSAVEEAVALKVQLTAYLRTEE
ncbi:MAG: hypothetical protein ACD_75C02596G0003 [uncultured bacterium]|uniref:Type II secretion system protein PulO, putative n=1 Tax=Geobacter sulfurreducens (strain ATCC 51573 / DSM 12127 / PCA) TaxID=243231 RepID=Q74C94_GEOSL|nr:type 4a pilus biogenesis protein PilO [Geobacter sulfurreducens]ADI84615.2 type II secretion system protein PulO, putative [Geobacter sulfurreducens KN400]EKD33780.1 MAG: hypothetical protein ACD_75C02596G0003 [uncultured bacterium]AAR35157.1 type II secretion system protein PulO, putative [Geobacter sulfurreducens PCA]AJY71214.1 pilus assembly protein PilO [Geobacter sulfurreducens]QVW33734.1 type 4a pilus biogenesis protein PilO [Geobacter sulfurreducens]